MLVFDISDFAQNATKVFDAALTDEVIINNEDGKSYKILPINDNKKGKSPLEPQPRPQVVEPKVRSSPLEDIPYITADITTQEIVGIIRENRAGI
jgi:hypothetical protein